MQGRNKKKAAGLFFLLQSNQFSNNDMASDGNPIRRAIVERFVLPVDVVIRSPEVLAEQHDETFF